MAGLIKGASMVSTPSGDREEVTFSMLVAEGRLERSKTPQLVQRACRKMNLVDTILQVAAEM